VLKTGPGLSSYPKGHDIKRERPCGVIWPDYRLEARSVAPSGLVRPATKSGEADVN
jgi:hypothetical protein